MSDLVGNPEDRFSHVAAQMVKQNSYKYTYESSVRLGEECLRRLSHCVEAKLLSGTEIIESVLQRCIF